MHKLLLSEHQELFSERKLSINCFLLLSLTSRGEGASLALVVQPSSDGIMIKMPYGVDVLYRPALHPIFSYWVH